MTQHTQAWCRWEVPGVVTPSTFFTVQGVPAGGTGNLYQCMIPDWSTAMIDGEPAINKLPCNASFVQGTNAQCLPDGRLVVPFGVAFLPPGFVPGTMPGLFAMGNSFTYYAHPRFQVRTPSDTHTLTNIHSHFTMVNGLICCARSCFHVLLSSPLSPSPSPSPSPSLRTLRHVERRHLVRASR